jgi:hypothetical protein
MGMDRQTERLGQALADGEARVPRRALDAFFPATVRVGDLALQPLTLAHYAALARLDCPLARGALRLSAHDTLMALYVCALPAAALSRALALPRGELVAEATDFGLRVPAAGIADAADALRRLIDAAFSTATGGGGEEGNPPPASAGRSRRPRRSARAAGAGST